MFDTEITIVREGYEMLDNPLTPYQFREHYTARHDIEVQVGGLTTNAVFIYEDKEGLCYYIAQPHSDQPATGWVRFPQGAITPFDANDVTMQSWLDDLSNQCAVLERICNQ